MSLKGVAFIVHPDRAEAGKCAEKAEKIFGEYSVPVYYPQNNEKCQEYDCILTFGGDGTLLIGADYALRGDIPILGINLGTTGFLTEGEPDELRGIIHALMENRWSVEERSLLKVSADNHVFLAMNDAVVTRGGFARLIRVKTYVNNELLGTFTADGMIAATPTGSTGYSLSAGGPIVSPGVGCIIITPVCAHSFQKCPCVVPNSSVIRFHLDDLRQQSAELQIDGRSKIMLNAGSEISVTGSEKRIRLVRIKPYRFFSLITKKLNEWSRT